MFQAELYATLACVYEIQMNVRQEKYVSICSDSQEAISRRLDVGIWTGLGWPRIETGGGRL